MTHFHRFALVLCCIFPLLLGTAHAQAGGNAVNIPGIGRVIINPDGTITLPGGQTIAVNPNGTITLPGGQVINLPTIPGAGGGGGGGGGIINPNTDPRIIAGTAIVIGDEASAAVVVPNAGGGGGLINNTATYLWTITGGRLVSSDLTRANIDYTADQAGTVRLTCVVTVAGAQPFTATADVTVVDPATAGVITTTPTLAAATTATGTASVPAAQNADRTIRWTVTGSGARITAGATTNQITFIPGDPGIKELTCAVTLTAARITVTLRSFIVVQGSGPAVTLTVNGGFGGGTYPGGSRVDVFAAVPAAGQVFDRWTGDTSVLGTGPIAPLNSRIQITLPSTPVTLTATYKAAPAWVPLTVTSFNPQQFTPQGATAPTTVTANLTYYIPPAAAGVVFFLHATGDSAATWFNSPESALLMRDLVSAGYGVAALSSVNRTAGNWNAQTVLANNPDALNHVAALNKFAADGLLPASRPVFMIGFAAGAGAAARFADLLIAATPARPVRGTVMYCNAGNETSSVVGRVPALFVLADNDSTLGVNGATTARTNSQLLAGRGIASSVFNNVASPVHPGRFRALGVTNPAFTNTDATTVWNAVKAAGLIDANNYVKAIPTETALAAAIPFAFQARRADIAAQLETAYAEQAFTSDANARVVSFIGARGAETPAAPAGRMMSLSTRIKLAAAGDTLTFGFSLIGSQKATLLVRGIGPGLAAFGVPGTIAAPRLEIRPAGDPKTLLAENEGWDRAPSNGPAIAAAAAANGAFAIALGSADAAVLIELNPGNYTATFKGINGSTGEILAEAYDISKNGTRLANLATLANLANPGDIVTAGISVSGNPRTLIVRGVGPGLADLGLPGTLPDPNVTILTATATPQSVAANNNWSTGGSQTTLAAAFPMVGAFPLKTGSADAVLVHAFTPGGYNIQTTAAAVPANMANPPAPTGTLLIEVYEAP